MAENRVEARDKQTVEDESDSGESLVESLELLIERDNPMAEAAERALELL